MADDAEARRLKLAFEVVGYTSVPSLKQHSRVHVHGRYTGDDEAVRMLRKMRPDVFFMSSVWPETYVFTLSVAMALGLPVVSFDLGAQADRVRRYGRGHLLDHRLIENPAAVNDALLALDIDGLWERGVGDLGFHIKTPFEDYFGAAPAPQLRSAG
jgi:glycosyltransferase involved in cell wall biosynthesis